MVMNVATVNEFIAWFEGNEKLFEQLAMSLMLLSTWQGLSRATNSFSIAPRESEAHTAKPVVRINISPFIFLNQRKSAMQTAPGQIKFCLMEMNCMNFWNIGD